MGLSDYYGVILFYSAVLLLIYYNRKKFEKQATLMYLYKTKIGLKFMDAVSKKFGKPLKYFGYFGILVAYLGFFLITYALLLGAYDIIIDKPGAIGGSPVIPGLPIAGLGITFPLIIGWISLFIIMIVHEFSHGIWARLHKVKIKSSGIAFFGPIMGAFVEPDEKELVKKPHIVQHSIFAAGPVSNIVLWIVCTLLVIPLVTGILSMTQAEGVRIGIIQEGNYPALNSDMLENSVIIGVNNDTITNYSSLGESLDKLSPGQEVIFKTKDNTYSMITTTHPENESKAYVGIWIYDEDRKLVNDTLGNNLLYKVMLWVFELLKWTAFISINIGLINLYPIFITDGARMLKLNFEYFIKDKKKAFEYWKTVNMMAVFIFLVLLFLPLLRTMFKAIVSLAFL